MFYSRPYILLISSLFLLGLPTLAEATDEQGNYNQEDFFTPSSEYAISTWQVVAKHLNCRQQPGADQPIILVFKEGDPITAQTSNGSHDNEGYLQLDDHDRPWMKVSLREMPNAPVRDCFVRAKQAYIRPVLDSQQP